MAVSFWLLRILTAFHIHFRLPPPVKVTLGIRNTQFLLKSLGVLLYAYKTIPALEELDLKL
ncbi:hypothetical protein AMS66_14085 [Paenibacillus xylanivorans]|uniref:Uncharacterized protein n=1 Tax=Paenibacillus xylanivorans TaxID=1705561 RepID=A0A0N0C4H2_9BACL|nr:hypothetical protein AMS66_14085 [Paenibacillus xylanivorans]